MQFDWTELEKLDAAVAWRREAENAALANVWHLETVAGIAHELRRLLELEHTDGRLIALLWRYLNDQGKQAILDELGAPGSRYPNGVARLSSIVTQAPS